MLYDVAVDRLEKSLISNWGRVDQCTSGLINLRAIPEQYVDFKKLTTEICDTWSFTRADAEVVGRLADGDDRVLEVGRLFGLSTFIISNFYQNFTSVDANAVRECPDYDLVLDNTYFVTNDVYRRLDKQVNLNRFFVNDVSHAMIDDNNVTMVDAVFDDELAGKLGKFDLIFEDFVFSEAQFRYIGLLVNMLTPNGTLVVHDDRRHGHVSTYINSLTNVNIVHADVVDETFGVSGCEFALITRAS